MNFPALRSSQDKKIQKNLSIINRLNIQCETGGETIFEETKRILWRIRRIERISTSIHRMIILMYYYCSVLQALGMGNLRNLENNLKILLKAMISISFQMR